MGRKPAGKLVVCPDCKVPYREKNKETHEKTVTHKKKGESNRWAEFFFRN